ncbi:GrpB family protein [Kineococcus sp. NPDC059986]|uniref:GrpB family protein n=1 Tax=Kineococcus sp. NPDC059986 TaxID=3155538 RepID=UPI00344F0433
MDDPRETSRTRSPGEADDTARAVVVDHDPRWARDFDLLRAHLEPAVADLATSIEHVGSTSVTGMAAKPTIDVDVVVADERASRAAVHALAGAGWVLEGDLGVTGRLAFRARPDLPHHHLYVVVAGSRPHLDHVLLREHLRRNPAAVERYSALKREIAPLLHDDREAYLDAKATLVQCLIAAEGGAGPADRLVSDVISSALLPYGPHAAEVDCRRVPDAEVWITDVEPRRDGAARLSVGVVSPPEATGTDVAFTITVAHTWLEVDGLVEPMAWLRALADAVFAGEVRERGFPSASAVHVATGAWVVTGGAWQPLLLRGLLPRRRFLPYGELPPTRGCPVR